jgi:thiol-disulfide isomerase/thioredoxin
MLRKARFWGGAAVTVAALALVAACSGGIGSPVAQSGYVQGTEIKVFPLDQRVAAPPLTGGTLDGSTFSLAAQRGHVVVINIWASWCSPCRAEAPALEQVAKDTQAAGVRFVGLNTRDQNSQATAFLQNDGITYPSLVDPDGTLQLAFDHTVPPQSVPSTLVIDRQGRIAAAFVQPVTYTTLVTVGGDARSARRAR